MVSRRSRRGQAICEEDGVRCLVRREDVQKQNAILDEAGKTIRSAAG
jgi:hypothetical protein